MSLSRFSNNGILNLRQQRINSLSEVAGSVTSLYSNKSTVKQTEIKDNIIKPCFIPEIKKPIATKQFISLNIKQPKSWSLNQLLFGKYQTKSIETKIKTRKPETGNMISLNARPRQNIFYSAAKEHVLNQHRSYSTINNNIIKDGIKKEYAGKVALWLSITTSIVGSILIIGAYTRISGSGLSMTSWKFLGTLPPTSEEQWIAEFERYKEYPEYKKSNSHITLDDYKEIFWPEYIHRTLARVSGIVFLLPFLYFIKKGALSKSTKIWFSILGSLGAAQGLIGWWMVKSGLVNESTSTEEEHETGTVCTKRLLTHFSLGTLLFAGLLGSTIRARAIHKFGNIISKELCHRQLRILAHPLIGLPLIITLGTGAIVSGTKGRFYHNTYPHMSGEYLPDIVESFWKGKESFSTLFSDPTLSQWNHRLMAHLTVLFTWTLTGISFLKKQRTNKKVRAALVLASLVGTFQLSLGAGMVLSGGHPHIAISHHIGALSTLSTLLYAFYQFRLIPKL